MLINEQPLLIAKQLTMLYNNGKGFNDVNLDLYAGEIIGIVGESGSGKTSLLKTLSGRLAPQGGKVLYCSDQHYDVYATTESRKRQWLRTEWGIVHQHPLDGLHKHISAGGNIGERLMGMGKRHYGTLRRLGLEWLEAVEIDKDRIDDYPQNFSGGMQQRLQIAKNLVSYPKILFMDEPTGGLDVSVQARILDLLRNLVEKMNIAVIIVTHDLAVARLLADRLVVMKDGFIVEAGLTDRVLDDPFHPYTQLLVSSVLQG